MLVLLKSITNRDKDFEDIETIVKIEPNIDWNLIIDYAIMQSKKSPWILIGLEEKMQRLKKITFIKKAHLEKIYAAQRKTK